MKPVHTLGAVAAVLAAAGAAQAQCSVQRFNVPDFDQRRSTLADDGSVHCVPTSAINWMAYISNYGWPLMMSGPRNWQSQTNYSYVTSQIDLMGDIMGTAPPGGTGGSAGHAGIWVFMLSRAPGLFTVTTQSGNIGPTTLATHMYLGRLVNICYGYYKPNSQGRFARDGGHCVTLNGVYNWCTAQPSLRWRDPASDSTLTSQSTFVSKQSSTSAQTFVTTGGDIRTRWRLWALGTDSTTRRYVDRYYSINPLICLTASAVRDESVLVHRPVQLASTALPAEGLSELPDASTIRGIDLDPAQLSAYVTSRLPTIPLTTKYWRHDLATGQIEHLLTVTGAACPAVTSRFGDIFLYGDGSVRRYTLGGAGLVLVSEIASPIQFQALAYDDARDEIVGLSTTSDRLVRFPLDLSGGLSEPLPSGVTLTGDVSFVIDPGQQRYIMCGSGSPTIYNVGLIPGSPRLRIEASWLLPAVASPRGLQRNDQGHLLAIDDGVIGHFAPGATGGWVPVASSPLAGLPALRTLCVARSRHDIVPEDDATPAWRHVTEPEGAAELPDCSADWDASQVVNSSDISAFLTSWLASVTAPDLVADFDNSGVTNSSDISAFLSAWLADVAGDCY